MDYVQEDIRQGHKPIHFFAGKFNGASLSGRQLRNIAKPRVTPKALLSSCKSLIEKLDTEEGLFYIAANIYIHVTPLFSANKYKMLGNTADSFAMIECFGIGMPDEWKLDENEAENMMFSVFSGITDIKQKLGDAGSFREITDEAWIEIRSYVVDQFESTAMNSRMYSAMATAIYSLCRQGQATSDTMSKLTNELSGFHGFTISVSANDCQTFWNTLGKLYTMSEMQATMKVLLPRFCNSIRLTNLVIYAEKRSLTSYYLVGEALNTYADFNWAFVLANTGNDFTNYTSAVNLVKDQPYFGYNANIGIAAATFYPNLAYIARELAVRVGGQSTLRNLHSSIDDRVAKERWNKMIDEYKNKLEEATFVLAPGSTATREFEEFIKKIRKVQRKAIRRREQAAGVEHESSSSSSDDSDDNQDRPAGTTRKRQHSQKKKEDKSHRHEHGHHRSRSPEHRRRRTVTPERQPSIGTMSLPPIGSSIIRPPRLQTGPGVPTGANVALPSGSSIDAEMTEPDFIPLSPRAELPMAETLPPDCTFDTLAQYIASDNRKRPGGQTQIMKRLFGQEAVNKFKGTSSIDTQAYMEVISMVPDADAENMVIIRNFDDLNLHLPNCVGKKFSGALYANQNGFMVKEYVKGELPASEYVAVVAALIGARRYIQINKYLLDPIALVTPQVLVSLSARGWGIFMKAIMLGLHQSLAIGPLPVP